MDLSEFESRLKAGVGGRELWNLRKDTAMRTAADLSSVGRTMSNRNDLTGEYGEAVRAMGSLLQMAGELTFAAGRMLSGHEHYAGAALLRQIVEIEYRDSPTRWGRRHPQESVDRRPRRDDKKY